MNREEPISNIILQRIDTASSITLVAHIRPDGDAIGSVLGFGSALQAYGKPVSMAFEETLPQRFRYLNIENEPAINGDENIIIALDCADQPRMAKSFTDKHIDINIDHHATNTQFATLNYVNDKAAATAEIIFDLLQEWSMPIPVSAANALLMGIITDTIGFRTPNTTAHTLRVAAQLMEKGAQLTDTYQRALTDVSWEASLLWSYALSKLQKEENIIYTVITCEDREKSGYAGRDDADLTNFLSSIQDAEISILFNQQGENACKVSWRSRSEVNVATIAAQFGGGGHPAAAGAEIGLSLQKTQQDVLRATKNYLKKIHN
ncbi:MAG: bifunctional oligoribonuclease/PAP phosphatase NrnA [Chloroflexi bacterium]|jgi:phosphoesterase RecJ-like protein|nr:bifunctional oligoribonuclease/PAP phosphatase NrnA [Chloroflexota bacterium]